ncbi:MAG: CHAD domain-containing protein [Ilumatobacteraceae bacterium]
MIGRRRGRTPAVREIEQKFELADDAELPALDRLDGVGAVGRPVLHELSATYYDTPDGRLAATGVALRRRHGGHDEGWHLKESVGRDERLETHAPLGAPGDGVPEALAALVRSRTRRRGLVPIATVRTDRTVYPLLAADGTWLAEVADDRTVGTDIVHDRTAMWREVEVELGDGDRALLAVVAQRLTDAGATPSSWSSKLGRTLDARRAADDVADRGSSAGAIVTAHVAEQVEQVVRFDPLVRQDAPDAVHKMRVGTRRLRSALATFRRVLDRSVTDPARDELKWLAGVLGAARDVEVIHARLRELLDAEPAEAVRGPVRARVNRTMAQRSRTARRRLVTALDGDRYLSLLDALDGVATGDALRADRADRSAERELPKAVRRSWERWRQEVDILEDGDDTQLHEVRKAAKRVRYAAESVEVVFGSKATKLADRMEELQEVLGAHQDALVVQAVLVGLADDALAAGEDAFTYGRLHALEQGRADAAERDGRALLARLGSKPPKWLR